METKKIHTLLSTHRSNDARSYGYILLNIFFLIMIFLFAFQSGLLKCSCKFFRITIWNPRIGHQRIQSQLKVFENKLPELEVAQRY